MLALAVSAGLAPAGAQAMSTYYATACGGCHGATPTTCNGCHRHRGTISGSLAKTSFTPGESMAVTVTAGQRTGWWRAAVLDASNQVVGTASATAAGATTVTVTAPSAPGTYAWKVAWYGNQYTEAPAAASWVADPNNSEHGYFVSALASFTVTGGTVTAPVAALAPATLSLGSVTTGQSSSLSASVSNSGNADLVVTAPTACSGTNPASFTVSPAAGFTVPPNGTATVTVAFAPTATGAASACFAFGTNDTNNARLQLNASGTGVSAPVVVPVSNLSPTSLDFGTVNTGQTGTLSATLGNTGNADLVVSSVAPCGGVANPAAFAITPAAGFTVAPGASSAVTITFTPSAAGALSACWALTTNDPANAAPEIEAFGTGAAAPPPPSCTGCHSIPPSSGQHALHAGEGCGACHGAGYSSTTVAAGTHNNGTADIASSAGWTAASASCSNACHGTQSWGTVVPPPTQSCTTCHATPPTTGSHTAHAAESCGACHGAGYSATTVVAATHQDGSPTLGAEAGWNTTSRSCANACHTSRNWSGTTPGGGGACNSCHAMPPSSGKHALHRSEDVSCSNCHGSGYSTTAVNSTTHNNGTINLTSAVRWNATQRSCSNSCHGTETWGGSGGGTTPPPTASCTTCHATPPATGEHAKHRSEGVSCGRCHGSGYSATTVNTATHQNGAVNLASTSGWNASRRSCSNSCHGSESWGGTGGGTTPPTTSCTTCHGIPPTTGAHSTHGALSCANCHGNGYSKTTVNAATHNNGTKNVATSTGWSATRRSCSNSCHGTQSWGGSTGGTPPASSCTTCHRIPPSSGEHAKHQSERISCASCHGTGYSSTTVVAATHNNGSVNLTTRAGFNASRRTCSNSCHGTESWTASSGGGDDHEEEDFVLADDRTTEPKAAGGCNSAGSALPLLGLLGVALLGARRRRAE